MSRTDSEEIIVIRTLECDLCLRFDSIMLSKSDLYRSINQNAMEIGTYQISHGDHSRIVYYDKNGKYLGDTISLRTNENKDTSSEIFVPIYSKKDGNIMREIQKKVFRRFITNNDKICIVGPSFVGKTSLTLFLQNGIPERYTKRIDHAPTFSRSVKRFKLGKSKLTLFDMGGQRDFWSGWQEFIEKADRLIFVMDGTKLNIQEDIEALNLVLGLRAGKPMLILLNKMDLFVDGYTSSFTKYENLYDEIQHQDLEKVWVLEASVYNGICYNFNNSKEETPLLKIIDNFIHE